LNPKRIAIAGKIRVFLFDKTGTLTHEGLDFIGAWSVVRSGSSDGPPFGHLKLPANGDGMDPSTLHGLATCHAVTKFDNQFVGNQVEVKSSESFKLSRLNWLRIYRTLHGIDAWVLYCR